MVSPWEKYTIDCLIIVPKGDVGYNNIMQLAVKECINVST